MNTDNTTIAAISTPQGNGAISIVRLSGPAALNILAKIFVPATAGRKLTTHTIHYGTIQQDGALVDEVLVSIMLAPKTYTKEDVIEINCHGGNISATAVLNTALKNGATMAEPGEFTKRAFLNGRINLSQAEAVIDLINATSNTATTMALSQLAGGLGNQIKTIRQELLANIAALEVAIDYPEEDYFAGTEKIKNGLLKNSNLLQKLIDNSVGYSVMKQGLNIAIVGKPNVGKSSLLNTLLQQERAIVTDIPGTTRDTITEHAMIGQIPINIVDTAGLRETSDIVEKIGQERTGKAMEEAAFIFVLLDISVGIQDEDIEIIEKAKQTTSNVIIIANKTDIDTNKALPDKLKPYGDIVKISATTGQGLDRLKDVLLSHYPKVDVKGELVIANMRHIESLQRAKEFLSYSLESIDIGESEEFISLDITSAYKALGEILGDEVGEDIVDKIFSEFCLGK